MAIYLGENEVGFNTTYGGIVPSGTSTITENGIYDVTNFASASVSVAGGSSNDFIVTLSQNAYSSLTIDKTFSEIISAFSASKKVVAYGDGSPYYMDGSPYYMGAIYVDEEEFDYIDVYGYSFSGDNVSAVLREDYYTFGSNYSIFNNTNYYYEPHNMNATPSDVLSGKRFVNESGFQVGTAIGGGGYTIDDIAMRTISGDITGNVTEIGFGAFARCSQLTAVSFSNATLIGNYAFYFCNNLTAASFPNVTTINVSAFANCTKMITASFPNATNIGSYAFAGCTLLTNISFPNVTSIGVAAFETCGSNLTTASFPKVSIIGSSAFSNCQKLTNISFPDASRIDAYAFNNCQSLININFPKVGSINSYAFSYCVNMTTASFPKVTVIGSSAFNHCHNLLSLYLLGSSIPTLSNINAFGNTPISTYTTSTGGVYGSIFVPESLYSNYIAATRWSTYSARIVSLTDAQIVALQ